MAFLVRVLAMAGMVICAAAGKAGEDSSGTVTRRPNIVLIMADDLGQESLGCYGNDALKTPYLNAMAREGMRFTEAYSTPLCSPSRVQIMTGKYNNRNYWAFGLLDKNQKTFADYLKDVGYVTGIAGKWQLLGSEKQQRRGGGRVGARPNEVGFDDYCVWQVDKLGSRYKNPTVTMTTGTAELRGEYGPDVFSDFACRFIRQNREKPFFLYYPMVLTHAPFQPTPGDADYESYAVHGNSEPRYFPAQVAYMDKLVGKVLGELRAQGLERNTLVIFTGDNGNDRAITTRANGRDVPGGKGAITRRATRVPLLAWWPGTVKSNQVNDNLVDFTDMLPTFLEVAGEKPRDSVGLDGCSFLGQLLNRDVVARDWVFCYYYPQLYNNFKAYWAHDKKWKLNDDGRFYNTVDDPEEQKPIPDSELTDEGRFAKARLLAIVEKCMAGERAPLIAPLAGDADTSESE